MSYSQLSSKGSLAILVLRVSLSSFLLLGHGLGKLQKLFSSEPIRFLDPIGLGQELSLVLAAGAEVIGSALILLGLWTRIASIPVLITLGVACFIVHGGDGFSGMEKLLLFIAGFVTILIAGPGKYSIDARR